MYGFYRIAAIVPKLSVADVTSNVAELIRCAETAAHEGAAVALFPELCVTGYTCGDLFHQSLLLKAAMRGVQTIARETARYDMLVVVGAPVRFRSKLYNCALALFHGKILSVTPKTFLPNQREFYEKRHFSSGRDLLSDASSVIRIDELDGELYPVRNRIHAADGVEIGIELCEDLWSPIPPSLTLAASGCNLILNLSASNALVSKSHYRRELVKGQSARCMAVYAYASAGVHESTTDTVYGGHAMIAENGSLIAENKRFQRESEILYADVDLERLNTQRISEGSFQDFESNPDNAAGSADPLKLHPLTQLKYRRVSCTPFVPGNSVERDDVCAEIFQIQCAGLAKRLEVSRSRRAVIGISGGLDSTLALLVAAETCYLLGRNTGDVLSITMPGFGTTSRTLNNAKSLTGLLGAELREIDIKPACLQHFKDIGHDRNDWNVTYENVQARERTQILMDTANRENGLVVGTGDLSEIALGWSTYNADHMSMYAVNCGVPKTLVRHLVEWYADKKGGALSDILRDILDTPVSPELLPTSDKGEIVQKTELILGAYELHDFYLYHVIKYGAEPAKLKFLANYAFGQKYPASEIDRTMELFFRRFFTQQFKRSCIPDGPKVGSISLSPRADWRMPSDASPAVWLASVRES